MVEKYYICSVLFNIEIMEKKSVSERLDMLENETSKHHVVIYLLVIAILVEAICTLAETLISQ